MQEILRINMKTLSFTKEKIKENYRMLSGSALISQIMIDEVDPLCDPLGRKNKLIYAPGILAGSSVPCSGRISIGAKSPLTKGIKEANAGGDLGHYIARNGYKAIIIEDQPCDDKSMFLLRVDINGVEFLPADFCKGNGVYKAAAKIYEKFDGKNQISLIGPAGEMLMLASGIANTDKDRVPSRFSGRGGLGAVMGSKGIKAIVVDGSKGQMLQVQNQELYKKALVAFITNIKESPAIGEGGSYPVYGTAANVDFINNFQGLPTRNFSEGAFEDAQQINGKTLYDNICERGGEGATTHACMSGCIIKCSNIYPDKDGSTLVSPIEYETIGLLGSNLGIGDLDDIARLNYLCNDLGLDTLDAGGALGIAMEEGLLEFGDAEGAYGLLEEVSKGTMIGRVLGNGASTTGTVLGARHIPVVLNQCMPAYEPRCIKGFGVTYTTNAMGADHTKGCTHKMPIDHQKPEGQAEASYKVQLGFGLPDILGFCLFSASAFGSDKQIVIDLVNSLFDTSYNLDDLMQMVRESLNRELEFNEKAGLPRINRLPEYMYFEENKTTGTVFDVSDSDIQEMFQKGF